MKIAIIGAGALGAYFGLRWLEAGNDVTFVVRKRRAVQMEENGIHIQSPHGDFTVERPDTVEDINELEDVDLIIVAVKGYHLEGTLPPLRRLTAKGAKVLPVLNGMEHVSILQKELGEEAVLGGLSYIISTLDDMGHVIHSSDFHDIVFGPLHPSQENVCEKLALASEQANMNCKWSSAIQKDMWNKYMFINAFSGITTAANLPIGKVREQPDTFSIAEKILQEMKQLANEYHIELTDRHVGKAVDQLKGLGDEATSSMHQDRRKGLTLEVDHLHGGALRMAEKKGVSLPYIQTIHGLIKPFEETN